VPLAESDSGKDVANLVGALVVSAVDEDVVLVDGYEDVFRRRQVTFGQEQHPDAAPQVQGPSAGIIDSQSVKAADTVGRDSRGYDAGKKVSGRKRFIVTDTLGLLITVTVCAARVQDRDGAKGALLGLYLTAPTCRFVFADAGFAGGCWTGPRALYAPRSASSVNPPIRRASRCCPAGGRWNGRWRGSPPTADSHETTNATRPPAKP
jgi:hypothetical protein